MEEYNGRLDAIIFRWAEASSEVECEPAGGRS
jgi:hypothetical protein